MGLNPKAENYLFEAGKLGIRPALDRIGEFYQKVFIEEGIGLDPEKVVHITGTNGKGSVTYFTSQLLLQNSKSCTSNYSPHVICLSERIRVGKDCVSLNEISDALIWLNKKELELWGKTKLSFFEVMCMAYARISSLVKPDFYLVEVGLGGRLDGTRIFSGKTTVLTSISIDHKKFLSSDPKIIAWEKLQLLTQNGCLITQKMDSKIMDIVEKEATEKNAKISILETSKNCLPEEINAALAKNLIKELIPKNSLNLDGEIQNLPGRKQVLKFGSCRILLDGAHNQASFDGLIKYLKQKKYSPQLIIFSALRDKPWEKMIQETKTLFPKAKFYFVVMDSYKAKKK